MALNVWDDCVAHRILIGFGFFSFEGDKFEYEPLDDDILMLTLANRPRSCNILVKMDNRQMVLPENF